MKNFLILGVLAVSLFSVSAALSLWLNQAKQTEVTEKEKDKENKDKKEGGAKGPKEAPDQKASPKGEVPSAGGDVGTTIKDREAKLQYRQDQIDVVLRDIQVQREATDATLAKVLTEAKNVGAETAKLENAAKDLKRSQIEIDAAERENIKNLAAMYESMSPESAAAQLKDAVENGKLDSTAKIVSQIKPRNAAKILEALPESVARQVTGRMEKLKPPAPVVPAKGP
jgi:flagellar motility protein MotE (MotC chaperone)